MYGPNHVPLRENGQPVYLILIPFNPTGSVYDGSSREAIERFRNVLIRAGIPATVQLIRAATSRLPAVS
jgi:hypothetical protein